jgi:wyosine [tRNA(Phe)-imidazoG37] synthetase (radical SAM superfamily)
MPGAYKYLYGPVPSRRLGLSLGVDIVPYKICTLDCVYCQLGRTTRLTTQRRQYVAIEPILAELRAKLSEPVRVDYITIGGSGEPTLNSRLGDLIDAIRAISDRPVAILTNGTLLYRADVRRDCAKSDVVLPSLDAGDAATFGRLNRPSNDISIEKLVFGLNAFRDEFPGQLWLEVFVVKGLNTDAAQIAKLKELITRIRPDKIHLNTAVRPPAEKDVERADVATLQAIAGQLGPQCEIIADVGGRDVEVLTRIRSEDVLSVLKRRPCSVGDIAMGLDVCREDVTALLTDMEKLGLVSREHRGGTDFYRAS